MGKAKMCNSIVHYVAADGYRMYFEKTDIKPYQVIAYKGKDMTITEAYYRAVIALSKDLALKKLTEIKLMLLRNDIDFPPHSLFCECTKCAKNHGNYKKLFRS